MSDDLKKEAVKQYFHYFRFWFLAVGILLVITVIAGISHAVKNNAPRQNTSAPAERVYDYADLLTDEEEQNLREYIARKEEKYKADFVVLTFSQPVEGAEAAKEYGYRSEYWENNMMDLADDFWDENGYGYNKNFEGDGSILIDNRYEGQRGEWLSTSGKVEECLGDWEVEEVLYAVDEYYDSDPYSAYVAYIDEVCFYLDDGLGAGVFGLGGLVISVIVAAIYAGVHLGKNKAQDNVASNAYVTGGTPMMRDKRDEFIRKSVVTQRIQTDNGGSRSGGGGGHHTSRSGASHGGGGYRH